MAFDFLKKLFGLKQEKAKAASDEPTKAIGAEQDATVEPDEKDWVKMLELVIVEYCEKVYKSRPSFSITKNTNFKRNLNFDGIDMAEISMAFEEIFPVRIPDDHPYNHRLANDTDFTVGYFLSAYGLIDYDFPKETTQNNGVKYVWIIGFYDWDWNKPNPWGNPTYGFKPNPNSRIEKDKKPEIGDSFESKGESLYVEKCEFHQKLADGTEEYYVVPTKDKMKDQAEKVDETSNSPSFSRDELSALCTIALSLVDDKTYNPKRVMTFMHEQEGFDEDEVYRKIHSIINDFDWAFALVKSMTALNKREYAASFFAAVISSAEFDENSDSKFVLGWQNCVKYLLRLNDDKYCNFNLALERYANRSDN